MNIKSRLLKLERTHSMSTGTIVNYMSLSEAESTAIQAGALTSAAEAQILARHNITSWPRACKTYVTISPDDWDQI